MMDGMVPSAGRREDRRLLTGAGRDTGDHDRPGQLHAVFVRSDRAHARIVSIDATAARAAPGVSLILTRADTRDAGFHRTPALLPFPGRCGAKLIVPPRRALADDKVRYVGEPVLLVLADTVEHAMDAAELATIEYDDIPVLASAAAALAPGADAIHAEAPGNECLDHEYGDEEAVHAAFAATLTATSFGRTADGQPVTRYTMFTNRGVSVSFMSYGGAVTDVTAPDRQGRPGHVVLGFPTLRDYETKSAEGELYFGAILGRYTNWISRGRSRLDGREYQITLSDPPSVGCG